MACIEDINDESVWNGQIAREDQVVEIDKAKFGKWKYNRGRIIPGQWIFGGYHHLTVNHTYNFVDPQTGTHTNTIERLWRTVRSNVPVGGRREDHMIGYLAEHLFKSKYSNFNQRFHHLLLAAAKLYPPDY
ncbi:uncharacterized protein LOC111633450 [Centruroides sculpturatus]|uniref:uncharacterized protein LOC111633450 n=1 Tax=Centruroides sculpturatus TaxID=218467 RepID=UPI000C6CDD62|nr:uncharacterized protein LOC111633450 [Centruroides sculpturatus]